jgi:hypothetical protein
MTLVFNKYRVIFDPPLDGAGLTACQICLFLYVKISRLTNLLSTLTLSREKCE